MEKIIVNGMSNHIFSIKLDHADSKTKLIECKEKGLLIKVLSKRMPVELAPGDALLITADFYKEDVIATEPADKVKSLHFLILNIDGPNSKKWNRELFFEAIDFYCNTYLKLPKPGFRYVTGPKWYPFEPMLLEDDGLDCISPANIRQPNPQQLTDFMKNGGAKGDRPK